MAIHVVVLFQLYPELIEFLPNISMCRMFETFKMFLTSSFINNISFRHYIFIYVFASSLRKYISLFFFLSPNLFFTHVFVLIFCFFHYLAWFLFTYFQLYNNYWGLIIVIVYVTFLCDKFNLICKLIKREWREFVLKLSIVFFIVHGRKRCQVINKI